MTPFPIAPLLRRLTRWRIARLSERIRRIERWMDGMPISATGPTYGELGLRVQALRREVEALQSIDVARRSAHGLRRPVRTAPF